MRHVEAFLFQTLLLLLGSTHQQNKKAVNCPWMTGQLMNPKIKHVSVGNKAIPIQECWVMEQYTKREKR